ncbi:SGNH/GDSL hydrolase family protein [Acidicapsa ligni]|uniref:SGNH/GDSL hydrolase family protein n=1 Tax=Acidicapsa ligni TaxID=542300 RepID=UPI0021E044CC|nr:SGNH/GDSL hydrolase family protein [Acidicapsa ligni]
MIGHTNIFRAEPGKHLKVAYRTAAFLCLLLPTMFAFGQDHWVTTWAAAMMQQTPLSAGTTLGVSNQTVRNVVHLSIGGKVLRIRFANTYGSAPLVIGEAHVALRRESGTIEPGTDHVLTFGGSKSIQIPVGAPILSDPISMDTPADSDLAVSVFVPGSVPTPTIHELARQTTYVSGTGNFTGSAEIPKFTTQQSWYFLQSVEVLAPKRTSVIVAFGDSITDGAASTIDANRRWPNFLESRLRSIGGKTAPAVIDEGIAGNRLLHDGWGPNALARFDRDVLAHSGVSSVVILEGINDLGFPRWTATPMYAQEEVSVENIITAYKQLIARAHARGIPVYIGTMTPFEGSFYFSADEQTKRQALNDWIRSSGSADGTIDFDAAVRDPSHPSRLLPLYDSGDHLHLNDAGYERMANAIDLRFFKH